MAAFAVACAVHALANALVVDDCVTPIAVTMAPNEVIPAIVTAVVSAAMDDTAPLAEF